MKTKTEAFPLTIKSGSVGVKIYRGQNRGTDIYTLTWIEPSGRKRESFRVLEEAKKAARSRAESLSAGDHAALRLNGDDRRIHLAAMEYLPDGVKLDVATRDYAEAVKLLDGHSLVEAAKLYARTRLNGPPIVSIRHCAESYLAAKEAEGLAVATMKARRWLVKRIAKTMVCDLVDLSSDMIRQYVTSAGGGAYYRNGTIKAFRLLLNYAKKQGWLPKNETTAADGVDLTRIKITKVEVFSPAELIAILGAADPEFRVTIILNAFCGVRVAEVSRMNWSMVNFETGVITLPETMTKTERRRKMEFRSAVEKEPRELAVLELRRRWLEPYRDRKGPIFPTDQDHRLKHTIRRVKETLPEFKWKQNGLRHSFCSYRLEQCRNAGQVALEAGNSAGMIMRHYHELVSAEDAAAYWAITPDATPIHPETLTYVRQKSKFRRKFATPEWAGKYLVALQRTGRLKTTCRETKIPLSTVKYRCLRHPDFAARIKEIMSLARTMHCREITAVQKETARRNGCAPCRPGMTRGRPRLVA